MNTSRKTEELSLFSCENITRYYESEPVILDISLALHKGELVSLLGPSGVGKTTLFHILSGVDSPDRGNVFLAGEDITGRAGKVGYMLQKDMLLPYKTILDNVCLPFLIQGMKKTEAYKLAAPHFPAFGLEGYERHYPNALSGGMRQRAALLRTFLMGSPVTLLDEPFSALDALTKRKMHRWYLELVADNGMTTLFITHDIEEALLLSDTIYIMAGRPGQLVKQISIPQDYRKDPDFVTSSIFLEYKREILQTIEL